MRRRSAASRGHRVGRLGRGSGGPQHLLDRQAELAGQRGDVLVLDADVDHPAVVRRRPSRPRGRRARRPTPASAPAPPCPPAGPAGRWTTSPRRSPPAPPARPRGPQSADSVCAGRPFFIRIGVSQASEAPGGEQRVEDAGPQPRVEVVDVGLEDDGAPGRSRRCGRLAEHQPDDVRQLGRVAAAGARCRRARPASAAAPSTRRPGRATSAAPVGVHISAGTGPGDDRDARPAAPAPPGRGSGRRRARRGPSRCPARPGDAVSRRQPEVREPGDHADDVGERVQRTDLVEVHLVGRDPVHPALGDGQPLEHRQRAVADGGVERRRRRAAPRTSGQVRWCGGLRRVHVHPGGAEPVPGDLFGLAAGSARPAARRRRRPGPRAAPRRRRARRAACRRTPPREVEPADSCGDHPRRRRDDHGAAGRHADRSSHLAMINCERRSGGRPAPRRRRRSSRCRCC